MIRALWVGLNLLIATTLLGSVVILSALLRVRGGIYDWASRHWSRWVLWASGVRLHVEGLENVHIDEPQVFCSNHVSWYDVWSLAAIIPKRYRFIAKKELSYIPLFGLAWKLAGHISVDRSDRAAAIRSLDEAGALIRDDHSSVVIFPEGTRSADGILLPFKKGAFMLALHSGVDIVPIACVGTRHVLPKDAWRVRPGDVTVKFGTPIATVGYNDENRDELIAKVRSAIEEMLETPQTASSTS